MESARQWRAAKAASPTTRLLAELVAQLPAPVLAAAQERGRGKELQAATEILAQAQPTLGA